MSVNKEEWSRRVDEIEDLKKMTRLEDSSEVVRNRTGDCRSEDSAARMRWPACQRELETQYFVLEDSKIEVVGCEGCQETTE